MEGVVRMTERKLTKEVKLHFYDFSDSVKCVEVLYEGEGIGAFCTDITHFSEWDEEEIRNLAEKHVQKHKTNKAHKTETRERLRNGIEIEYYSHSDDMMCVNIYKKEKHVGSFCTLTSLFDEWKEDERILEKIIEKQVG